MTNSNEIKNQTLSRFNLNLLAIERCEFQSTLDSLKNIKLDYNKINDIDLVDFTRLPRLEKLYLKATGVNLGIVNVDSASPLQSSLFFLHLGNNNLTNAADLEVLRIFPNLTDVNVGDNHYDRSSAAWQNIQNMFPRIDFSAGSKIKWVEAH